MVPRGEHDVVSSSLNWQTKFSGRPYDVPIPLHYLDVGNAAQLDPDVVLFLGFRNGPRAYESVLSRIDQQFGVTALGVEIPLTPKDSRNRFEPSITNFEHVVKEAPRAVFEAVNNSGTLSNRRRIVISYSMGAGVVGAMVDDFGGDIGNIMSAWGSVAPVGAANPRSGRQYADRFFKNARQPDHRDLTVSNLLGLAEVVRGFAEDARLGRLRTLINYANSSDTVSQHQRAAEAGVRVGVLLAKNDRLFPYDDMKKRFSAVSAGAFALMDVEGSHASPSSASGWDQISDAIRWTLGA